MLNFKFSICDKSSVKLHIPVTRQKMENKITFHSALHNSGVINLQQPREIRLSRERRPLSSLSLSLNLFGSFCRLRHSRFWMHYFPTSPMTSVCLFKHTFENNNTGSRFQGTRETTPPRWRLTTMLARRKTPALESLASRRPAPAPTYPLESAAPSAPPRRQ